MMFMFLLLQSNSNLDTGVDMVLTLLFIVLSTFVILGFRANAFTVLPVFILIVIIKKIKTRCKIYMMAALSVGTIMVSALPAWLAIDTMSSASAGFVWEMIMTIKNMDSNKQMEYMDYLDVIGGEGSTQEAVLMDDDQLSWNIWPLLTTRLSKEALSEQGISSTVLSKYVELLIKEPFEWVYTKWYFVGSTLGIRGELKLAEWDYNRNGGMESLNYCDSIVRHQFVDSYSNILNTYGIVKRPIILMILSLCMIIIQRLWLLKKVEKRISDEEIIFLMALFYYSAFLINNQSFEFRYYYPSYHLMKILCVSILIKGTAKGIKRIIRY